MSKPKVATVWLEGCSGCHMSFLDLDQALLPVLEAVELTVSPLTDFKDYDFGQITLGIVEGAVGNAEQVEILHRLRASCQVLMAWGDCAVMGGIPLMRNHLELTDLLERGYRDTAGSQGQALPLDPSLPTLLPKVLAVQEVVPVEIFVPGCPPSPPALAQALNSVLSGQAPPPGQRVIHYD